MYFSFLALFVSITSPAAADMRYPAGEESLSCSAQVKQRPTVGDPAQTRKIKCRHVAVPDADARRRPQRSGPPTSWRYRRRRKGKPSWRALFAAERRSRPVVLHYNCWRTTPSTEHPAFRQFTNPFWPPPKRAICSTPAAMKVLRDTDGEAPPEGWPTVIFLHTCRRRRHQPRGTAAVRAKWACLSRSTHADVVGNSLRWSNYSDGAPRPPFSVRCNSWLHS